MGTRKLTRQEARSGKLCTDSSKTVSPLTRLCARRTIQRVDVGILGVSMLYDGVPCYASSAIVLKDIVFIRENTCVHSRVVLLRNYGLVEARKIYSLKGESV